MRAAKLRRCCSPFRDRGAAPAHVGEASAPSPPASYVRPLLEAIRATHGIKALAHITGRGAAIPTTSRASCPAAFAAELDLEAIDVPKVFSWLVEAGRHRHAEMLRTVQCGIGMVGRGRRRPGGPGRRRGLQKAGETVTPIDRVLPRRDAGALIYRDIST